VSLIVRKITWRMRSWWNCNSKYMETSILMEKYRHGYVFLKFQQEYRVSNSCWDKLPRELMDIVISQSMYLTGWMNIIYKESMSDSKRCCCK
jgi:hypothetical protein